MQSSTCWYLGVNKVLTPPPVHFFFVDPTVAVRYRYIIPTVVSVLHCCRRLWQAASYVTGKSASPCGYFSLHFSCERQKNTERPVQVNTVQHNTTKHQCVGALLYLLCVPLSIDCLFRCSVSCGQISCFLNFTLLTPQFEKCCTTDKSVST